MNSEFELRGVNHLALVCRDMDRTVDFSNEVHEGTFIRSIYFKDPDGILLEFAAWTRQLNEDDVRHRPATAAPTAPTSP